MTDIRINTDEVRNVGSQFNTKAGELDGLINQAKRMMDNLAATWTGMRKTSTFNEWERVYQGLKVAVENVQVTSRILN